jgi:hypothetical protein
MKRNYRVTWIIDIDGEDHKDAAVNAFNAMQDLDSTATYFSVKERRKKTVKKVDVKKAAS